MRFSSLAAPVIPLAEDVDVGALLEGLHAILQRVHGITGEDGAALLQDDGATVDLFGDLVDGASGFWYAGGEDGLVDLAVHQAGEGGKQRGMHVEKVAAPVTDEVRREDAHIADEEDEFDACFAKFRADTFVVLLAREAGGVDEERWTLVELRAVEDGRGGLVRDNDAQIDVERARGDGVEHAFERGAARGSEDADAKTHEDLATLRREFMWSMRREISAEVPMSERWKNGPWMLRSADSQRGSAAGIDGPRETTARVREPAETSVSSTTPSVSTCLISTEPR